MELVPYNGGATNTVDTHVFTSRDIQQLCEYCTLFVYNMYFPYAQFLYILYIHVHYGKV